MSDYLDDVQAEDPDELRREIQERGAPIAYRALLAVCENPKSPAPAKATAGIAILRAAGFLQPAERKAEDEIGKFSVQELERLRDSLERQNAESSQKAVGNAQAAPGDKDLFA